MQGKTRITHPQRDVYELLATYTPLPGQPRVSVNGWTIQRMHSMYRINEKGYLLALAVTVDGAPNLGPLLAGLVTDCHVDIQGEVRDNRFFPRLHLEVPDRFVRKMDLPAVEVSHRGSVLLPLHPVHHIRGLSRGQTWRMPVLDPLGDSINAFSKSFLLDDGPRFLSARVKQDVVLLDWQKQEVPCLVIDYEGQDMQARTWVEERNGRVLRQEATLDKDRLVMERDR
jgi:hypothetical protein